MNYMLGSNIAGGLSLTKIISGISKSLTIVNQVIPIYQQAKPMISNARKVLGAIKEFSSSSTPVKTIEASSMEKENPTQISKISNSNPVFFQ